eukprot:TRINITY_DN11241_c0_g1_i1.p2 TRINITY_DN11241_c0_g1~~TRINITY_DN11241_c0_g1_i1.p2  ORF type:complete len:367 (+),score=61.06 TRINITY_DN11241_c0_g1_i1:1226-2326(+)
MSALLLKSQGVFSNTQCFDDDANQKSEVGGKPEHLVLPPYEFVPVGESGEPRAVHGPLEWKKLPENVQNDILMDGKMAFTDFYCSDAETGRHIPTYRRDELDKNIEASREGIEQIEKGNKLSSDLVSRIRSGWYPCLVTNVLKAIKKYPLVDKDVLIMNPVNPWTEGILLAHGVGSITVSDDRNSVDLTGHKKIKFIHHNNLSGTFDAIFKMDDHGNAFNHVGLGRYGDLVNPNADIQKIDTYKHFLKEDGIMFFTTPVGPDRIEYNAHRIYGPVRLPMLLASYDVVEQFPCFDKYPTLEEAYVAEFKSKWENQWLFLVKRKADDSTFNQDCNGDTMSVRNVFVYVTFVIVAGMIWFSGTTIKTTK